MTCSREARRSSFADHVAFVETALDVSVTMIGTGTGTGTAR